MMKIASMALCAAAFVANTALATPLTPPPAPHGWTRGQVLTGGKTFARVIAAPPVAGRSAGVSDQTLDHFLDGAVVLLAFRAPPVMEAVFYDPLTRCVVKAWGDVDGRSLHGAGFFRVLDQPIRRTAIKVSLGTSLETRVALAHSPSKAGDDCARQVETIYGADFASNERRFGSLAQFALSVLGQGSADDAKLQISPERLKILQAARARTKPVMHAPVFLGAVRDGSQLIVMIGDRRGSSRWLTQYTSAGSANWKFMGAIDAGIF